MAQDQKWPWAISVFVPKLLFPRRSTMASKKVSRKKIMAGQRGMPQAKQGCARWKSLSKRAAKTQAVKG
jgi:hypothetical protein